MSNIKAMGRWLKRHLKPLLAGFGLALIGLLIVASTLVISFHRRHQDEPLTIGVSFSEKYAHELGINWQAGYTALLSDLRFKNLRLMSYWDLLEPKPGDYNFKNLDWQFAQARQYGAKITLAIGLRQPRWPECHWPSWVNQHGDWQQDLLAYLKTVVTHYKNSPVLVSYQLENESSNQLFGRCPKFDRDLYQTEYSLIASLDPGHSIITNVSNQIGLPLRGPVGGRDGISVYRKVYVKLFGISTYVSYWFMPPAWHSLRAAIIEKLHRTTTFVHELQAEPWGPQATVKLSPAEQAKSMNPDRLRDNLKFAMSAGFNDIYLWGGEWWYWRLTHGDPTLWETARQLRQ